MFRNKKTRIRNLLLLIAPFVIAICVFGFLAFRSVSKLATNVGSQTASYSNYIEGKNIYLRDNATSLQKDLFKQLQKAYEGDDDLLTARLTAECFVADFYTWTNKHGSYDVGGIYYVADRSNVEMQGRDTFYKYVSYYIEKYGSENLLEVVALDTVDSNIEENGYYIESIDENLPCYAFRINIDYANHEGFGNDEYVTILEIRVVKTSSGRFEIVEVLG